MKHAKRPLGFEKTGRLSAQKDTECFFETLGVFLSYGETVDTGGMNVPASPGTIGTAGMAGIVGQTLPRKPQVNVAPGARSVPSARAVPTADVKKIEVAVAGEKVTLAVAVAVGVAVSVAVGVDVSVGASVGVSVGTAVGGGAVGDGGSVAVGTGVGSSPQAVTINADSATTEIKSFAVCL